MCGIAAALGIRDPEVFRALFGVLGHRGPDESGMAEHGDLRLGMHRLSIVGESGMTLPLASRDGRWLLVFNGEIYNHRSLRDEFRDYPFRTGSDGEVLFPLIAREGPRGLDRLRGMFGFVLVDLDSGNFLAARDPFGIKPLYMARLEGGFVLASELKSFAGLDCQPAYVPPGHYVTCEGCSPFYKVPPRGWRASSPSLRACLEQAVASHLPSDGPCGVFLSGGLDSSLVAALAARIRPDMVAYSVVLPGSPDEEPAAQVAAHLGLRHRVLRASHADVRAILPQVVAALESYHPVMVRNAVPLYLLSSMAAKECKVVLGGDGADELFAGYDYLAKLPRRVWPQAMDHGISNLHRTELQRVDRMTMAHGLELRVPFLDRAVAEAAINLPLADKVRYQGGKIVTKWALRQAAEGLLPDAIRWRRKIPLVEGSGFAGLTLSGQEVEDAARAFYPLWRAGFPKVDTEYPIWRDAGQYHQFTGYHGRPLLELFRR